ncbi:MAG: heliorhodopsin HeR [Dehalococcoidia bacterium]
MAVAIAQRQAGAARLRQWNLAMGALHFIQGVGMLALASSFALPVTAAFVVMDPESGGLEPDLRTLFDVRLGPVIASFLFLSAVAHLAVSLPRTYRWYTSNLAKGINYARWVEYSLSSSVMIVAIGMIVGIYDVAALIGLFGLNAMMIFCGWMMERHNQLTARVDWTSYVFGCFAGALPWVAIFIYLIGAGGQDGGPPTFVYAIFVSIFAFFNVFALNMFLQYRKLGPWRSYLFGEKAYLILSLTAKSALAWQVYAGTLQPS